MAGPNATIEEQRRAIEHMAVLSQYGRAMLAVQLFEVALARAAQVALVRHPHRRIRIKVRDHARKMLDRMFHWYWKASAAEAHREAARILPTELGPHIEQAIKWRNRLAHRYLREQLWGSADGRFADGTYKELIQLTRGFEKLGRRIDEEVEQIVAEWPKGDPLPPRVSGALERAAWDVFSGGRDVSTPTPRRGATATFARKR